MCGFYYAKFNDKTGNSTMSLNSVSRKIIQIATSFYVKWSKILYHHTFDRKEFDNYYYKHKMTSAFFCLTTTVIKYDIMKAAHDKGTKTSFVSDVGI